MTDQQKTDLLGRLRRGREFHRLIQEEWHNTAEGQIAFKKACKKPTGRQGFMDIHVHPDTSDPKQTAVVEVKCSDWDRMTAQAVRRNVRRQIKQIWDYIESELALEKEPCPGVIFPKKPMDSERAVYIETTFNDYGIQVVWHDESPSAT